MRSLLFLLVPLLVALPVAAHESGSSYETDINGYTVDVGYSTEEPTNEEVVAFDFQLQQDEKEVPFTDVWVKIENDQKAVVFAGGMYRAEYGGARLSYRFPEAGAYTINVRYEDDDAALAEVSLPMTVTEEEQAPLLPVGTFAVGAVLGALGVYLYFRRRGR